MLEREVITDPHIDDRLLVAVNGLYLFSLNGHISVENSVSIDAVQENSF